MNESQVIPLNLSVAEINMALTALGSMPFNQVFPLIQNIKQQADAQLATLATLAAAPLVAPVHQE